MTHSMRTRHKNNILISTFQKKDVLLKKIFLRIVRKLQQVYWQVFAQSECFSRFFRKNSHKAKMPKSLYAKIRIMRKL